MHGPCWGLSGEHMGESPPRGQQQTAITTEQTTGANPRDQSPYPPPLSGHPKAHPKGPPQRSQHQGANTCLWKITLIISAEMAPSSFFFLALSSYFSDFCSTMVSYKKKPLKTTAMLKSFWILIWRTVFAIQVLT